MTTSIDITPTKDHRGENFPVASLLIAPRHRGPTLAFYRFVRAADDVADHPSLSPSDKFALMDRLEEGLLGKRDDVAEALPLRAALAERDLSPRHAQDLLTAFRMDVTKLRYKDWDDLLGYCMYSANPVGRFVLDVHGEDRGLWPANDALCTALQIINHLQDCGKDYRELDRVYIPLDAMARCGMSVEELGAERGSPALLRCVRELCGGTSDLLRDAARFGPAIEDLRLGLEVSVIHRLALDLVDRLMRRDPLSERMHHNAVEALAIGTIACLGALRRRATRHAARTDNKVRAPQ
jgi:squalene synthase HpnC